ncbi:MAG: carboxy terminal-processing peptidase [Saprospiraceae bacterium]|nr:carboxy terminal-processing peptidase [Saprospiraceae bacterium]
MTKKIWYKTLGVYLCLNGMFLILGLSSFEVPGDKYDQTLHAIGKMLNIQHYAPKKMDDSLSSLVYTDYLKRMDADKSIFLQSDIASFEQYKFNIDDEVNGAPVEFFYKVIAKYKTRIDELKKESADWFKGPFVFKEDGSEIYYPENKSFPVNAKDRSKTWISRIRYNILENYVEGKDARDLSKIDSIKNKTNELILSEAIDVVKKQYSKILEQYASLNNDDELFSIYANAVVNRMDPHSDYFLPIEKRTWNERISGKFYGIGATIGEENGFLKLATIAEGGPAWKSGEVDAGDLILKVGQGDAKPVDVAGYSIPDGVKLIRGENQTIVSLTLKKMDGNIKVVKLVREELKIEETFARSNILKTNGKKIGIINLPKFYSNFGDANGRSCAEDVARELERLKADTVDGVIMDLRSNGGGSLQEVVNMVGLFIPEGPVVQVKGKTTRPGLYLDRDPGTTYSGPLAVMINEFSASASEIFAAAIQDYRRGVIVGSGSYGKGTVQRPYDLNHFKNKADSFDLGSIHITMQKYYRVNGSSVQLKGVTPDIRLNGYYENHKVKEKDQETALPWDELSKQQYTTWSEIPELMTMKEYFQHHIDTAGQFARFDENAKWLAYQNEVPKIVSEKAYRELVKNIREKSSFNRSQMRIETDLDVYGIYDGTTKDKIKIDRNNRVTNFYKRDRYLAITGELMSKWIDKTAMSSN